MKRLLSLTAITAAALTAQDGRLSGPVAGYVFDTLARVVRPIQGIPGASTLGTGVDFGFEISSAAVAPNQDSAIVTGADRSLHFYRIGADGFSERKVDGIDGAPRRIVYSPSGTAAALVLRGSAVMVTGLPDAPAVSGTLAIPTVTKVSGAAVRDGRIRVGYPAIALSDDGAFLLDGSGGTVELYGSATGHRTLASNGGVTALAFRTGSHDLAVADGGGLYVIADVAGAAERRVIVKDGLTSAVGLAFSTDGKKIYASDASAHGVATFDADGTRSDLACSCTPSGLTPMGKYFRLDWVGAGPIWVLDVDAPRIVFVPAAQ